MKVVSAKQMKFIESEAYRNGSTDEDFMELAGKGIALSVQDFIEEEFLPHTVYLLCGKGNNAGDAYVAGTYLLEKGYKVLAYQIAPFRDCTPLCQKNYKRFLSNGGACLEVNRVEEDLKFSDNGVVLDGLFGTGFQGVMREPYASAIKMANASHLPIIAIDIPSGVNGNTGIVEGEAIVARETIFLGLPKTGFFLQDSWNHVGKLQYVDFGLPRHYIAESEADFIMLEPQVVKRLLPKLLPNRHKYQAGFLVGLGGSPGMPGAALLSSLSALRGGAGIVKLLHPKEMTGELSLSPFEIIKIPYGTNDSQAIAEIMNSAAATFIGPGLGRGPSQRELLKKILPVLEKPSVIDADALTIIAEEKIHFPKNTILTPHVGEMMRLLKRSAPKPNSWEFLQICQQYAEEHGVTLVLKGGPSFIFHPHEKTVVNPFGDPGMATAGSGDVLTGILASLLAQKLPCESAAALGVYLHGVAGEVAAREKTSYCMIASDIIEGLPIAYSCLL